MIRRNNVRLHLRRITDLLAKNKFPLICRYSTQWVLRASLSSRPKEKTKDEIDMDEYQTKEIDFSR